MPTKLQMIYDRLVVGPMSKNDFLSEFGYQYLRFARKEFIAAVQLGIDGDTIILSGRAKRPPTLPRGQLPSNPKSRTQYADLDDHLRELLQDGEWRKYQVIEFRLKDNRQRIARAIKRLSLEKRYSNTIPRELYLRLPRFR